MIRILFYILFFISINKFYAQINFNWAKDFSGNYSTGNDMALGVNGSIYSVGSFSGVVDFDPGPSTFTLSGSGIYLTKFDTLGNFIWSKVIADGGSSLYVSTVKVDAGGNVFVFGGFSGVVDFDPTPSTFNLTGSSSIYISKIDASGNFLWAKQIDANFGYSARAMNLDNSGNIIFTGVFGNTVDFDPGPLTYTLNAPFTQIYVAKLDNSGNFIWANQIVINVANADFATAIASDNLNNIYFSFFGGGDVDFGPSVYNVSGQLVCKIDANANFIWAKNFGGAAREIAVNAASEIYFTGWFFGTQDFDPGPAIYNLTSIGFSDDAFICKVNSSGNLIWAQQVGSPGQERGYCIAIDLNNNSYIGGTGFYAKISAAGNFQWAKQLSPPAIQVIGFGIAVDLNYNIYSTGNLLGTADFNPGPNTYTLATATTTASEGFLFRWSPCSSLGLPPTNATNISNQTICSNNFATLSVSGSPQINWFDYPNSPTVIGTGSVFITPTLSAGTYTFYAESNSCSIGQTPITVNVNPSPTITVNSGSICAGQSFTLVPLGANTYTYSSGVGVVTPTTTTSYSVIGISSNGCVSSNTAVSSITVNPSPTITVASGAICSGGSFTISPTGANTYTYSSGTNVVSPITTTAYSVTGTSSAGCISASPAVISISVSPSPTISVSNGTICSGISFTINPSGANTYTYSSGTNIISPITTTSYSVSGTSTAGCISTTPAIVSVSVNQTPTITVNSGAICTGDSFTINPSGASTYTYSSGTNIVSPTTNSSYSVSGESTAGCISATPAISNVTVNALPSVNIATSTSIICTGQSATLIANGANTYSWNTTSTNTTIVISPTINTTYTVTGTGLNNCKNTAAITQSVGLCTGVITPNEVVSRLIKIYPNPSKDIFNISCDCLNENSFIEIYNTLGQLILEKKTFPENAEVDLSAFAAGLYYLKVRTQNSEEIIKLIKE